MCHTNIFIVRIELSKPIERRMKKVNTITLSKNLRYFLGLCFGKCVCIL